MWVVSEAGSGDYFPTSDCIYPSLFKRLIMVVGSQTGKIPKQVYLIDEHTFFASTTLVSVCGGGEGGGVNLVKYSGWV